MDKIKYEKQIVIFIDVLGTKEEYNNNPQSLLETLHSTYERVKYNIEFDNEFDRITSGIESENFKIFSDNIVITTKIKYDNRETKVVALHNAILTAIWAQVDLLNHGFLCRGGICYGDCFIDDIMVMGQALIDSYKLESKIAIYPRILIDDSLVKELDFNDKFMSKDFDEMYYADYIKFYCKSATLSKLKNACYESIEKSIDNSKDEKVKKKYIWLKEKIDSYREESNYERNER